MTNNHDRPQNPGGSGDPGDNLSGRRFGPEGRWIVEEFIGCGSAGTVWRAKDARNGGRVALKFLRSEHYTHVEAIRRFRREARLATRLRHENLARVLGLGREQGRLYIVSEFVDGEDLFRLMVDRGPLTPAAARDMVLQVARGVAELHANGVVHRDVKPENVLVSREDGRAKLLDLGIAKDLNASSSGMTRKGTFLGTMEYAAPEQARGRDVDPRTDVYALGVLTYELLFGRLPSRRARHGVEMPPNVPRGEELLALELLALARRMRARRAAERLANAQAVVDEITELDLSSHAATA